VSWLARTLELAPGPIVRMFARPYVAGDTIEKGLAVAHRLLRDAGIVATLDLLAEDVKDAEQVRANRETYLETVRAVAADGRFHGPRERPTVSAKLSSFTVQPCDRGGDARGAREAMEELAVEARRLGVPLTIDMEDHAWTDLTLEIAIGLHRRGFDVGTVLQTRLHRTERDLESIPEGMRVRMVIGIYPEPASIALTEKRPMKERLIAQSARLLDRGVYVEFATHDDAIIRRFFAEVVGPRGLGGERYELQMLFGVPRAELLGAVLAGELSPPERTPPLVRLYVPFATAWEQATAYCKRRLRSNPQMLTYVLVNLLQVLRGRNPGVSQYAGAVASRRLADPAVRGG